MFSQTMLNLDYIFVFVLFATYCKLYIMVLDSRQEAKKNKTTEDLNTSNRLDLMDSTFS